jgi:hypothetical protein
LARKDTKYSLLKNWVKFTIGDCNIVGLHRHEYDAVCVS